ncbi:hypothetical protein WJX74_008486 [Apatococcus lobatus]|uniref:Ribosomal RNA-processing protein 43 n=2 Tax=Apatococcus TaxID=904362 RepID=A0AAW1SI50_9CHLO
MDPKGEVGGSLEADAFRKLYPHQFYANFLAKHTRPDGRALMQARPVSVTPNAVSSADSSATAKLGDSAAIAGVKLEVAVPAEESPDEGHLAVAVEMAPMSSPDVRPGRPGEAAQCLAEQVSSILASSDVIPRQQLCIEQGRACWVVYLDIIVLNADGSLLDACLLAAWAALRSLRLPSVILTADGNVEPCDDLPQTSSAAAPEGVWAGRMLQLESQPVAQSCAMMGGKLISDCTAEEERLADTIIIIIVDGRGNLLGLIKAGGTAEAGDMIMQQCIEAAKLRQQDLCRLLEDQLSAATLS